MRLILIALCFVGARHDAFAADVVYIDKAPGRPFARQQMETATHFYGLEMNVAVLAGSKDFYGVLQSIRSPKTVAVVINAAVLPMLNRDLVFSSTRRDGNAVPLAIVGIDEQTSPALLREWSSGSVTECRRSGRVGTTGRYAVAKGNDVTRQLGGSKLPLNQRDVFYLNLAVAGGVRWLIEAEFGGVELPVFIQTTVGGQDVFFVTESQSSDIPLTADPYRQQAVFAAIASPMIFLRFAAGDRGWHSPASYANLTIDDLWLRKPYGHVNYEGLLREAEHSNFHTTIAFIPWNFDRSQPDIVSLFREHPDRLSVCIHGNNHVHQEFGPLDTHPLQKQKEDIRQGLSRMERFNQLTNIPYDAVMVFPHSISPEATFAELKRYNYLATVNSLSVPSDAVVPSDPEFALRAANLSFKDFPSLRRYSAETEIPTTQLAIDAFLGNPMLFYAHESFFASGIDAFNRTADVVNRLDSSTKWMGLGDIVRHLYLEKLRDDGNFDIRAYSSTVDIVNSHNRDAVFYIDKEEDFTLPLKVLVDRQPYPFQRIGTHLHLEMPIKNGVSHHIEIKYGDELNLAGVSISKDSQKITAIRLLSDFRDNELSNTTIGRWFIHSYAYHASDWNRATFMFALLLVIVVGSLYLRRNRKGYRMPPVTPVARQNQ